MADWQHHGRLRQEHMPDEVAAGRDVDAIALRHPAVNVEEITVRSPSPVLGVEASS